MTPQPPLRLSDEGLWLHLKVLPRASRSAILPPDAEGLLPVRLQAPPVDGAANTALLALLAEALGCPKGRLKLKQGALGRKKLVLAEQVGLPGAERLALRLGLACDVLLLGAEGAS